MENAAENLCRKMKSEFRFFQFLDEAEKVVVGHYFECREVAAGTVLWNEGADSSDCAFVVEGRVEVKKETEFNGKHVIVGIYGEGSVVGELCLLSGGPRAVTATALTDVWLLYLSREKFEQLMEEQPVVGGKLLKGMFHTVSHRLRRSYERLAAIF